MPSHVVLMKMTDQGARDIKGTPQRIDEAVKGIEAAGGKVTGPFLTMGEYDSVAIVEGLSDESVVALLAASAAEGSVTSTTLKAFTRNEFAEIIKTLP